MAEATQERASGGKVKSQRDRKAIGDNLRKLREGKQVDGKSLSQGDLAETLVKNNGQKWHFTYIGNIERGTNSPSQEFIRAAADFFGVKPEEILGDVKLEDLTMGADRAPRGSRQGQRRGGQTRRANRSASSNGNGDDAPAPAREDRVARNTGAAGDPVGLSLVGGVLKIVTGKSTFTVEGEFDGQIVNGRLSLAS